MNFNIYGRFSLNDHCSFGSSFSTTPPTKKCSFALLCKPDQPSQAENTLYFQYTECSASLAQGLCTWLSYQSGLGDRIQEFSLQLLDTSDETKKVAEKFAREMLVSPESVIKAQNIVNAPQALQEEPKLLLMRFPHLLRDHGEDSESKGEYEKGLDLYESAFSALIGWLKYRNPKAMSDWHTLLFDVITSRLRTFFRLGMRISQSQELLDNTLDLTSQDFIPNDKKVEFLQLYAQAWEEWGQSGCAFVLLLRALRLNPQAEELKAKLRRLRPASLEAINLMEAESGFFFPIGSDAVVSLELKTITKEELVRECSICIDDFQEGDRVEVTICDHWFHETCITGWLGFGNRLCPNCKMVIAAKGFGISN